MSSAYCFTSMRQRCERPQAREEAFSTRKSLLFPKLSLRTSFGAGHWVAGTARAKNGGIEVWYSLSKLPAEKPFNEFWRAQLAKHGLVALSASTGRAWASYT